MAALLINICETVYHCRNHYKTNVKTIQFNSIDPKIEPVKF